MRIVHICDRSVGTQMCSVHCTWLCVQLLFVRHQFKIAFFNELKQDPHTSVKYVYTLHITFIRNSKWLATLSDCAMLMINWISSCCLFQNCLLVLYCQCHWASGIVSGWEMPKERPLEDLSKLLLTVAVLNKGNICLLSLSRCWSWVCDEALKCGWCLHLCRHYKQAYLHLIELRLLDTNLLEAKTVAGFVNYKVQLLTSFSALSAFYSAEIVLCSMSNNKGLHNLFEFCVFLYMWKQENHISRQLATYVFSIRTR